MASMKALISNITSLSRIGSLVHVTAAELDLANEYIPTSEVSLQEARFMEDMLMRVFAMWVAL